MANSDNRTNRSSGHASNHNFGSRRTRGFEHRLLSFLSQGSSGSRKETQRFSNINNSGNTSGNSRIENMRNQYVKIFDANKDGMVSDKEVIDYSLKQMRDRQAISPDLFTVNTNARDILSAINTFDKSHDTRISGEEVADAILEINAGKHADINPVATSGVLSLNSEFGNISNAVTRIDSVQKNGEISDLEVLNTLLAHRRGQINIDDRNINYILHKNKNFESLRAALNNLGDDFNGTLSDREAFDVLLGLRQANVSQETLGKAIFLGTNQNATALDTSVKAFDSVADGIITDEEFISTVMGIRADSSGNQHALASNILEQNSHFKTIKDIIVSADSNSNGELSTDEIISFTMKGLRGEINFDPGLIDKVLNTNSSAAFIKENIAKVDTTPDGNISNEEFIKAVLDIRQDKYSSNAITIVNKLLDLNTNSPAINTALNFVDSTPDGIISELEVAKTLIAKLKNQTSAYDANILDLIINSNSNKPEIANIINTIAPNGEISVSDTISVWLGNKSRANNYNTAILRDILTAAGKESTVNALDNIDANNNGSIDIREYTQALMQSRSSANANTELINSLTNLVPNGNLVNDIVNILDSQRNGQVTAQEYNDNFMNAVSTNGNIDLNKIEILGQVGDLIYPMAASFDSLRRAFDVDNNKEITDTELINGMLGVKAGTIANPSDEILNVIISANPNKSTILQLLTAIDSNGGDGVISDAELTSGLLKFRKGEFNSSDPTIAPLIPGLVSYILNKNSNYNDVQNLMNFFHIGTSGKVEDLDLVDALFKLRRHEYPEGLNQEAVDRLAPIITTLKSTNLRAPELEAFVNAFDPNGDGKVNYSELVKGYLRISGGTLSDPGNEIKTHLPNISNALYGNTSITTQNIVNSLDGDHDGIVSNTEIARLLLADRTNNSYSPELKTALLETNDKSSDINSIINLVDTTTDGILDSSELVKAIIDLRKGNFASFNPELVTDVLKSSSLYQSTVDLINSIDNNPSNGDISNLEAMKVLVKIARNQITDSPAVESILDLNNALPALRTAYTAYNVNPNSSNLEVDLLKAFLKVKIGQAPAEHFDTFALALGLNQTQIDSIKHRIDFIDENNDGNIDGEEFTKLMVKGLAGEINLSDYQPIIDMLITDPTFAKVKTVVDKFDANKDGIFSDKDILDGLLAVRKATDLPFLNDGLFTNILGRNAKSNTVVKLLNAADPLRTGIINGASGFNVFSATIGASGQSGTNLPYDFNGDGVVNGFYDSGDWGTAWNFYNYVAGNSPTFVLP